MVSGVAAASAGLARSASGIATKVHAGPEAAASAPKVAATAKLSSSVEPRLLRQALDALNRHAASIPNRDRIAIVDFSAPSSRPRLHFLNVASGETSKLLVAHGSGSDPRHTGFLQSFSNAAGSNASSEGAFLTSDYYVGKHGRSQRLIGLDETNNNALSRAIVIHGAWYANADMIKTHGKLGRSQGCFAVGENMLDEVFGHLGEGRLIYAAKA
ncbi:MAG: murein L,D-transpeptidase catalytic domain family protein [Sphingomonadales bacterium]|nr:murein L,D-transpeptidase catalytic domain family protein [Sphingomonadales bacterium]